MSLFRSILRILIACALIVAIFMYFGRHYPWILMFVMFSTASVAFLYKIFCWLRGGIVTINAKGLISVYERHRNPFGFWFYIFFVTLIGMLICGTAIYCLVENFNGSKW